MLWLLCGETQTARAARMKETVKLSLCQVPACTDRLGEERRKPFPCLASSLAFTIAPPVVGT